MCYEYPAFWHRGLQASQTIKIGVLEKAFRATQTFVEQSSREIQSFFTTTVELKGSL
jgi:hypothetical protein